MWQKKCTVNDPEVKYLDHKDYSVIYNYELIEDTRDEVASW